MKKTLSVLLALSLLSICSTTTYAAQSDDPELYDFAYSLGADKEYLGVKNYRHDEEHPLNNDCYVDFLYNGSVLEAAYAPAKKFNAAMAQGLCLGISIIEVLTHNGIILPSDIKDGAKTLSDIGLNTVSDRYITDYQAIQSYTLFDSYEKYLIASMNYDERIDKLIEIAEKSMKNNKYFLITFRNSSMSHAVCGIGIKDGDWMYNDINYDKCVLCLDSNVMDTEGNPKGFSNKSCIYINSKTKQCHIPAYDISSDDDPTLAFAAIDDESILNYQGAIKPSKEINTDLSKLRHFMSDIDDNIKIYSVSNNIIKEIINDINFIENNNVQHTFLEADSIHTEIRNRSKVFDLRYIDLDRWIDIESLSKENKNIDIDICDGKVKIDNKGSEACPLVLQIRMNRGSFNFEPYYWWCISDNVTDDLEVEIRDEGMLFKSSGLIDGGVGPFYYTLNEDGNYLSVSMCADSRVKYAYLYSENNVLIKVDKDCSILYYIDDNNDDIYDVCVEKGDINCDGHLNAIDASMVLSIYAKYQTTGEDEFNYSLGDINGDGAVNAIDASEILSTYAQNSVN